MSAGREATAAREPAPRRWLDVACGFASIRDGRLVECDASGTEHARLECLAATVPDLFGTAPRESLARLLGRESPDGTPPTLGELMLVSENHVHVVLPLACRPGFALLAVSPATNSLGIVVSAIQRTVAELGGGVGNGSGG